MTQSNRSEGNNLSPEKQNEYDEPWGSCTEFRDMRVLISNRGGEVCQFVEHPGDAGQRLTQESNSDRIVACVNALQGCPDPQAFVDWTKELYEADKIGAHWALSWLKAKSQ